MVINSEFNIDCGADIGRGQSWDIIDLLDSSMSPPKSLRINWLLYNDCQGGMP